MSVEEVNEPVVQIEAGLAVKVDGGAKLRLTILVIGGLQIPEGDMFKV